MHYLIYKTTCLVNSKYYVGKHKTQNRDDGYLGSGKLLLTAIKKYGRENFVREILLECSTEDEMNLAEKILVVPDREVNYNLCPGGQGGWGYLNKHYWTEEKRTVHCSTVSGFKHITSEDRKRFGAIGGYRTSFLGIGVHDKTVPNGFLGKKHTEIAKKKIGEAAKIHQTGRNHTPHTKNKMSLSHKNIGSGENNSCFATRWMTNGEKHIRISQNDIDKWIKLGYRQGRK